MGEGCVCYLSKALSSVILIEILLIKTVSTSRIEAMLSRAVPWLVGAHARQGTLVPHSLLMGNQPQQDRMTCYESARG